MTAKMQRPDAGFIERQRKRLVKMRDALVDAANDKEADEKDVNAETSGAAIEYEDDAQRLAALELDGNQVARDMQRLALVDRALAKIADGTYGLSDSSGDPIPVERLEAIPEAIYTVREQEALEKKG